MCQLRKDIWQFLREFSSIPFEFRSSTHLGVSATTIDTALSFITTKFFDIDKSKKNT